MEETTQNNPGPYMAQILQYPVHIPEGKKRITQAIAQAWGIPEDRVLGNTLVTDKNWPGKGSAKGERQKTAGERYIAYVNARKFYFYVMRVIKEYHWKELTHITGRKIAAMKFAVKKTQEHMSLEEEYMARAQIVLDLIERDMIIFPKPSITLEANVTVIDRGRIHKGPQQVQQPEISK
jgi:hypothetical protein